MFPFRSLKKLFVPTRCSWPFDSVLCGAVWGLPEGWAHADGGPNCSHSEGTELLGSSWCHQVTKAWQNCPSGTSHAVLVWSVGWCRVWVREQWGSPEALCWCGLPPGTASAAGRRLCERGGSLQPSKSWCVCWQHTAWLWEVVGSWIPPHHTAVWAATLPCRDGKLRWQRWLLSGQVLLQYFCLSFWAAALLLWLAAWCTGTLKPLSLAFSPPPLPALLVWFHARRLSLWPGRQRISAPWVWLLVAKHHCSQAAVGLCRPVHVLCNLDWAL